jgi:hypothetical protein|eukprot:COSAG01_NODE_27054_length_695_cov_23.169463_1_plen_85_part_00
MPRAVTYWEMFQFVAIFGTLFIMLLLLRGCFMVAANTIQEHQLKSRMAAAETLLLARKLEKRDRQSKAKTGTGVAKGAADKKRD